MRELWGEDLVTGQNFGEKWRNATERGDGKDAQYYFFYFFSFLIFCHLVLG